MQRWHYYCGWILCVPLIFWALTGAVFILKPGYGDAYEQLSVAQHTLRQNSSNQPASAKANFTLAFDDSWQEARLINTVIGPRLIVKTANASQHLNAQQQLQIANIHEVKTLLNSAISHNNLRYGSINDIQLNDGINITATTTTGVTLSLNWNTLALNQKGQDRKIIDTLYKLHYLQYTPNPTLNKAIATLGLLLLIVLTLLGIRMSMRGRRTTK